MSQILLYITDTFSKRLFFSISETQFLFKTIYVTPNIILQINSLPFPYLTNQIHQFFSCNVIIKIPADHRLYVTYQLYLFILKSYMPQSHFPCHRYELFFVLPHRCYDLISLIPTQLHISTSFFWNRSPTCYMWAKAVCFDHWLTKTTCRPTSFWIWPGLTLGTSTLASTRPLWQQSYIAMFCGNNARVKGLDVTLDDLAGCTRMDPGEWSDVSTWFIREWITSWTAYTSKSIVRS